MQIYPISNKGGETVEKTERETSQVAALSQAILSQDQVQTTLDLTEKKVKQISPEVAFLKNIISSFNNAQLQVDFDALTEENQNLLGQFYFSINKVYLQYYEKPPNFTAEHLQERLDGIKSIQADIETNRLLFESLNHSWKILTLDKALVLLDGGHMDQYKQLNLFANQLDKYEGREIILRSYLEAALWQKKNMEQIYLTSLIQFSPF